MSAPSSPGPATGPGLDLGDDPVATLEAASWALAAVIATLQAAATTPLADVLEADPQRTAVLEAVGLVTRTGGRPVAHPCLVHDDEATRRSAVAARVSSLRQTVTAATTVGNAAAGGGGWAGQDDEVLLNQGRASAMTGRALATRLVPALPGLAGRLAADDARILDVGTGVAALALALARELPHAHVVGIDLMERVLDLAARELAAAEPAVADRVCLRHQDVTAVTEQAAYDLVWLPAPFLTQTALTTALPRLADALRPGGWIVVGTNPAAPDPLRRAVASWNAVRGGGNPYDTQAMTHLLTACGLRDPQPFPTVPGGPILLAARRCE